MKLYAPSTIRQIKDKYGFRLSKSLGQNFLTDKNIIDKIIEESFIGEHDLVIEIGPGIGVLTSEAAEQGGKIIAVEIDKNLIPILQETLEGYDNVEILNRDILKTDLNEIIEQNPIINGGPVNSVRIIGNLPYYITTPIIMKILEDGTKADSITIMMQKEVADRIKAQAGKKAYGALSVAVQYYCTVNHVANVPKEVFVPQPKVDSTVIRLDIRTEKPVALKDEKIFFQCVKAGFGQRRKTMSNSLTGVCGLSKEQVGQVLESIGVDSQRRAETMNIEEFAMLANAVYDMVRLQL
ncbi:16S rRNA (adenine(1518)-N(6)/adenine(1519)-N(6))-dimethyltransferase RsmA [Aminipila luticellarii]|uniref:Ribosomal RNA small subunit methyltransferase A n=1 Tax=Aminipila luticellarii TaxID=2507160 RepID=A0A410PS13_9FIRM|nr:16S rRNA (adenine(1518)-N(6)/adenine(1519)-N(6))-dimethyltransferase RsmA [Aminipila luticellarii]QAT41781.1 16S rRNA (adenine(1518)-N(6)/adenine(1519)-N(6))-dimethyltransferase RsmA [Aminipila luticellarii]